MLGCVNVYADDNTALPYRTRVGSTDIKTLQMLYADGRTLQRPFLVLDEYGRIDGSDPQNSLLVSFDEMSHEIRQYTYTVYHLNYDFRRSDLLSADYLQGFTTQDITDYETSMNTQRDYTHYSFTFPNADMAITHSGNYVIHIYEDGDVEKTVADVCFSVVQPKAGITAKIKANTQEEYNGRYQQLDIDIDTRLINLQNPDDIRLVVTQNNRQDNCVSGIRPTYIEQDRLRYENNRRLIFEGGNEYRRFDTYSVYYAGYNVNRIVYNNNDYHALLEADDNRGVTFSTDKTGTPYIYDKDANGQFVVNSERTDYSDTEAEYMWVHWFFPMPEPFFDGLLYVGGDMFYNDFTLANRMTYDNDRKGYYLNALVKQGGYEYQYMFLSKERGRHNSRGDMPSYIKGATLLRTEGSHWQTNNSYTIYVYYRPFGSRADELIGLERVGQ